MYFLFAHRQKHRAMSKLAGLCNFNVRTELVHVEPKFVAGREIRQACNQTGLTAYGLPRKPEQSSKRKADLSLYLPKKEIPVFFSHPK